MLNPITFDGLIVDLDGVVWLGSTAIAGSANAIAGLRTHGIRLVFLTNDPTGSRADYVARLNQIGIPTTEDEIITSARALATCIVEQEGAAGAVFAIGSPSLKAELASVGLDVLGVADGGYAPVVAVGGHTRFEYNELRVATHALRRGARLYAAGRDATFPMPDGPWPATGAVLAAVEVAGGTQATVVGKPEPFIFAIARLLLGDCERVAVVGDHLDADIGGGRQAGLTTILVLSGTTSRDDLAVTEHEPDLVVDDLAALISLLRDEAPVANLGDRRDSAA